MAKGRLLGTADGAVIAQALLHLEGALIVLAPLISDPEAKQKFSDEIKGANQMLHDLVASLTPKDSSNG